MKSEYHKMLKIMRPAMKNTIQKELELAESKKIQEVVFQGKRLAKLTRENVATVELMIQNDSAYRRSTDTNAAPEKNRKGEYKYRGSSAYWMTKLKEALFSEKNPVCSDDEYMNIIRNAVESVDRENSTHLNADRCENHCGRQEITSI